MLCVKCRKGSIQDDQVILAKSMKAQFFPTLLPEKLVLYSFAQNTYSEMEHLKE